MQPESKRIDPVSLEILWTRLIAIADEAAATLVRTSFSPIVQESNDYACVLFDECGRAVAENTLGIPSFNAVLSRSLQYMLERFPMETWRPGDVMITNDPWIASGHLPDVTCITPIFHHGLVGFAGSIAHMADIGGSIWAADSREVYEEGLRIPPMHLYREGEANDSLIDLIRSNVRLPDQVMGDIHAQVSAGNTAAKRLNALLKDNDLRRLSPLALEICQRAESVMRAAIRKIPDGCYQAVEHTDGFNGSPLTIAASITVAGEEIHIDYAGTSPQIPWGLNCVYNYTWAYSCYPIKCAIDPATPRNEGSYRPIKVTAPEGSLLNPRFPAPVNARQLTGHVLSSVIYKALFSPLPDRVIAGSGSAPTLRAVFAASGSGEQAATTTILFANGGMGARVNGDGLDCTCFPSNVVAGSMEVIEAGAPLVVWQKELRADSGGDGKYRGGLGQDIDIEIRGEEPMTLSLFVDRVDHPAHGLAAGCPGAPARVTVDDRSPQQLKGKNRVEPGSRVRISYAGGGGYGDPRQRNKDAVAEDLLNEKITEKKARNVYEYSPKS